MAALTPVFNVQEQGAPDGSCIDLYAVLVTAPSVGRSLTGEADHRNLTSWLQEGEQPILLAERGLLPTMAQAMCTAAFLTAFS
jgi:transcriptional regulator of nitric oxide reductase